MSKGKFILVNGSFALADEYRISIPESEAFLFSEKIRAIRTGFPFFAETLEMFKLKLLIFNQSFPEFTDNNGAGLRRQLERTLTKNKQFLGAVLILRFSFSEEKFQFTIQSERLDTIGYELNEKGLYLGIFDKILKPASSLSNLSLGSEIYWNISRNHLRNSTVDCLALVNQDDQIIETPESNIYLIKGKTIRGASPDLGAFQDITKKSMLGIFKKLCLDYSEDEGLMTEDLLEAEEIMIVNAIEGIRWIVGFEGKRYFNNTIRKISELFNQRNFS